MRLPLFFAPAPPNPSWRARGGEETGQDRGSECRALLMGPVPFVLLLLCPGISSVSGRFWRSGSPLPSAMLHLPVVSYQHTWRTLSAHLRKDR
jgi:hypothetical protein